MFHRFGRIGLTLFAAALYGGPVLAGAAGHGWSVLPVFSALFLFYVVATRKPDLATGAGWAGLAIMAFTQLALVAAAWGVGLALAAWASPLMLPLWAPIAITGIAAGLGAWAWRDAAEMDVMLDSAIRAIEDMNGAVPDPVAEGDPWPGASESARAAHARFRTALAEGDGLAIDRVDRLLDRFDAEAHDEAFDLLYDDAGLDGAAHDPRTDMALLRYVARPEVRDVLIARGEAGLAPTLLLNAEDPQVRAEARARVAELVAAGAPAGQLPDPVWLAELAQAFPGEGFENLRPG